MFSIVFCLCCFLRLSAFFFSPPVIMTVLACLGVNNGLSARRLDARDSCSAFINPRAEGGMRGVDSSQHFPLFRHVLQREQQHQHGGKAHLKLLRIKDSN